MFIRPNWFVAAKRLRQMPEKEGGAEGGERGRKLGKEAGHLQARLLPALPSVSRSSTASVLSWCQSCEPQQSYCEHTHVQWSTHTHTHWNSQVNLELIFWMEIDRGSSVASGINQCWLTYLWCLIVHRKCQKVNRPTCECVNSGIDFIDALALCWTSLNQTCQAHPPHPPFHPGKMDIWLVLSPFCSTPLCIAVRFLLHIGHS